MRKYLSLIIAIIAIGVIVFCVATQSSNQGNNQETNELAQGSVESYLNNQADEIREVAKEETGKQEAIKEDLQSEDKGANEATTNNDSSINEGTPNVEISEAQASTNKYQEALSAFLKYGYYFKDGKKPEKIKSLASRVEILALPEEAGILGMFSRTFDFEGIEPFDRRVDLVYVNTSNKKFEDVLDEIVDALAKHEIILKDDPAAFINFNNEVPIIGGMTIINLLPHYRSDRLDVYKSYEIVFIGYHVSFNKNEILYMFKRAANK